jgi:hypothetical protein
MLFEYYNKQLEPPNFSPEPFCLYEAKNKQF